MEQVISKLLSGYESGHVGGRQLIQSLALLAAGATTASAEGFEGKGIDPGKFLEIDLVDDSQSTLRYRDLTSRGWQNGLLVEP